MVMNFEIPMWPQPGKVIVPVSKPDLSSVERDLLLEAFDSGWIGSNSKLVTDCEKEMSDFFGVQDSVLVSNGSVAIVLALDALGVGEGDEVIVESGEEGALKVAMVTKVHDEPELNPKAPFEYRWILSVAGTTARKEQKRIHAIQNQALKVLAKAERERTRRKLADDLREVFGDALDTVRSIDLKTAAPEELGLD